MCVHQEHLVIKIYSTNSDEPDIWLYLLQAQSQVTFEYRFPVHDSKETG